MYASLDDLKKKLNEDELIRLTDDNGLDIIDEATVNAAIEAAGVEIDSYLGERYSLPLSPVPGLIPHLAKDIAVYNLYARNHEGPTEHWQKRYDNAIKLLERIATGDVSLGSGDPDTGGDDAQISVQDRIFTRETMKGF